MLESDTGEDDRLHAFDGRQSEAAAALQRGVCRAFRALGHSVVTELPLANGRRADVVALSGAGDVHIVEIKSCLIDYRTDHKWHDYLPFCDRLYFAVAPDFPVRDHSGRGRTAARRPLRRGACARGGRGAAFAPHAARP